MKYLDFSQRFLSRFRHPRGADGVLTIFLRWNPVAVLLLACATVASAATTYTVNATTDSMTGSGTTGDLRYCTTFASGGDTIIFAAALSGATIATGSEITVDYDVTIDASSLPGGLTIDGGGTHRILSTWNHVFALKGLTLTRGNGTSASQNTYGGAIYNSGTLTMTRCTLSGNTASGRGGAIYNNNMLTLNQCTLTGNATPGGGWGGAIYLNGSPLNMTQCTLSGNSASSGGAIYGFTLSQMSLAQCTLYGNTSSGSGGAIYCAVSDAALTQCTFSDNLASGGDGGAIFGNNNLTLIHCTLRGNQAPSGSGGGVASFYYGTRGYTNCIVAGNTSQNTATDGDLYNSGNVTFYGANLVEHTNTVNGNTPLTGPVNLAPLGNYGGPTQTMPPWPDSAAINATGTDTVSTGLSTDQRGAPRTVEARPDIGAVESSGLWVQNVNDDGSAGCLRSVLATAAGVVGAKTILFLPTLAGTTITLGSEIILNTSVALEAGTLASGLTLSGGGAHRLVTVNGGSSVSFTGLTLSDGNGSGASGSGSGGGAILNNGALTLRQCTLSGSSCKGSGGGILNNSALTLTHCTLSGNSADGSGGAVHHVAGTLTMTHCTVSANSCKGGGGGLSGTAGTLSLANTIVAGNTGKTTTQEGDLLLSGGTATLTGANLIRYFLETGSGTLIGPKPLNAAPNLAPLERYGGLTKTMPPLPGSAAIDALHSDDISTGLTTDQRGSTRKVGIHTDLGAVESGGLWVQNANDDGSAVCLRTIMDYAAGISGPTTVIFLPSLAGATITLPYWLYIQDDDAAVSVDASSLTPGLTLSGGGTIPIFFLYRGQASLTGLTLTGGRSNSDSGAVYNGGTLSLTRCTLSGNTVTGSGGGAILNAGQLTMTDCTVSGNTASGGLGGGAIECINDFSLTMTHCTLSGNAVQQSAYGGGAIFVIGRGSLTLAHCTLSGNSSNGKGGAIYLRDGTLTMTNCLVAGNRVTGNGSSADLFRDPLGNYDAVVIPLGANLLGSNESVAAEFPSGALAGTGTNPLDPGLAPLGSYGGPMQTRALLPGSRARNAAVGSTIITDQRGFPMVGTPDLGAYEAGTLAPNYNAYIYETLPATATISQHSAAADYDGDGVTNTNEWAALTDASSAASVFRISSAVRSGPNAILTFPSVTGRTYTLWQSDTLSGAWTNTNQTAIPGNGAPKTFTLPAPVNGIPERFFRIQVGP